MNCLKLLINSDFDSTPEQKNILFVNKQYKIYTESFFKSWVVSLGPIWDSVCITVCVDKGIVKNKGIWKSATDN